MRQKMEQIRKEKIIAEYLAGCTSYRKLQDKYGTNFRNIQRWVQQFKGNCIYLGRTQKPIAKENPEVEENSCFQHWDTLKTFAYDMI
jgi:transposase-like protein